MHCERGSLWRGFCGEPLGRVDHNLNNVRRMVSCFAGPYDESSILFYIAGSDDAIPFSQLA